MDNLINILDKVINDAVGVGFPIPNSLERKIYIDKKTYDRVGACYRYTLPERYEIHLSEVIKNTRSKEIKNIIAHEVLHANFMTMEHNCFWKMYQRRMNERYGYDIKIKYSWNEIIN